LKWVKGGLEAFQMGNTSRCFAKTFMSIVSEWWGIVVHPAFGKNVVRHDLESAEQQPNGNWGQWEATAVNFPEILRGQDDGI
jgi:hypothetical protein